MKLLILCLALSSALTSFSAVTNILCVTDMKDIASFAEWNSVEVSEIFWIPKTFPTKAFESSFKKYVQKKCDDAKNEWIKEKLQGVETKVDKYFIEYSGVIVDGKKVILCQMHTWPFTKEDFEKRRFSIICDGGTSVCTSIFDPESKCFIYCSWNGEA